MKKTCWTASACLLLVAALSATPLSFGQTKTPAANPPPPAAATGSIAGEVVDKRGTPLAGAQVEMKDPKTGQSSTSNTDALGAFHIDKLEPGKYQLTISAKGLVSRTQKVGVKAGHASKLHTKLKPPPIPTPKTKGS